MPTNQAPHGDPAPKSGASRPSLMGPGHAGDSRPSILQALERADAAPAPAATAAPRHLGWKIGAAGLLLAAGLVWTLRPGGSPSAPADGDSPARMAKAPAATGVVPAAPVAAPASAASAVDAAAPATAAATIENLPPAADPAASAAAGAVVAKADAAPPDAAPKAPGKEAKKAGAKADGKGGTKADTKVAARSTSARPDTAAARKPAADAAAAPRGATLAADKPATARTAPHGNRRDADVEIVTALMSHIEGRPVAVPARPAPTAPASAPEPASLPDPAAPVAAADNIADLVATCRGAAGTDEALACRWRICKGYWGKAEACPARDRKAAERAARELQARGDS